ALARGDLAAAERHLRLVVAVDPLRESAQRGLMKLLAAGGNYAGAMQAYRELCERSHREINAEPDPETQALFQQIRKEARAKADGARGRQRKPLNLRTGQGDRNAIAVLPFINSTADPENDY